MRALTSLCLLLFYVSTSIYQFVNRAESSFCHVELATVRSFQAENLKDVQLSIVQRQRACFDARAGAWLRIASNSSRQVPEPPRSNSSAPPKAATIAAGMKNLGKVDVQKAPSMIDLIKNDQATPSFIDLTRSELTALIAGIETQTQTSVGGQTTVPPHLSVVELYAKSYKLSVPIDQVTTFLDLLRRAEKELK